jgi:NADH:ubiquinone oxidoreductase subunit 5 (subunit L)/multisubunit Na+/H+ antiporter MnhA subunit
MPLTFISALVAALSISGVPPLNGFVSKWMIYQGIIELRKTSNLWILWLLAAMFGSALTLASFMKLIHATFLGQGSEKAEKTREVSWLMWLPMIILAAFCVVFGVFAYVLPLRFFLLPAVFGVSYTGIWAPVLATGLILVGLLVGVVIYGLGGTKVAAPKPVFVGGEVLEERAVKVSGVHFYDTIREWGFLPVIYRWSEAKLFDVYEIGSKITFGISEVLKWLHSGLLHTYLAWMFLGTVVLFLLLVR